MGFFDKKEKNDENDKLPGIEEISVPVPAVSEYFNIIGLPELFREAGIDTLPVTDLQGHITGIVSEYDLASIIPEKNIIKDDYCRNVKVSDIMSKEVMTERKHADISELSDKIQKTHTRVIPVVDGDNLYSGNSVTRSAIISYLIGRIKPQSLGGLATPLGVYITDGKHQAGAGNLGLFLTGIAIGSLIVFIEQLFKSGYTYFNIDSSDTSVFPLIFIMQILLFLLILKFTPLAKIHAAEHQTINAAEKGLPLTLETVKTQPREHKRCGTNIMVLLLGIQFVIILFVSFIKNFDPFLQFIFLFWSFIFVFSNRKKWGIWLQKHFTTNSAPDKYILNGIAAGEEILRKHKEDFNPKPASFFRRLWCSAIIQIIAGFIFVQIFFDFIIKFIGKG